MKKIAALFSLSLMIQPCLFMEAQAARTSHRPWMAVGRKSSVDTFEQDRQTTRQFHNQMRRHSKLEKRTVKGDRIAKQASRYEGTRYRFGGDSKSKGFDCSGLVRRIYNDLDLDKLPHSSSSLYQMGHPVRMNELRAGDLVFFKNTYRRGISHVGVYAGSNRFIHARNRRSGVTITSLADPYFQLHYAGARRIY